MCRFHRLWAEDMLPDWEPGRNADLGHHTFLRRKRDEEEDTNPELATWIDSFDTDRDEASPAQLRWAMLPVRVHSQHHPAAGKHSHVAVGR